MPTARLHDGSSIDVTVLGDGDHPAVLLPVSTRVLEGPAADEIRAWGGDPNAGHTLATALAAGGHRVIAADLEAHLTDHPQPHTLNATTLAADLLAVADAAGQERFAYYGYSWLALAGLQLAIRTDRLTGLAMGGYPPLGGPYGAMLAVTRVAHRMALDPPAPKGEPTPGDWESVPFTRTPDQTQQYVTLYESLRDFDERAALARLRVPRLAFAGDKDTIAYGPQWDDLAVDMAGPLRTHRAELESLGWTVELLPGADHMTAMQADRVLPLLGSWLRASR
ncbi:alpha/beta fold hydrolase [Paractinoplanes globisporus]|uniref:Alpha/beta fold hydrolase n=1 Tax=Paractinoplanes globisporus TaxID=113565 RepID=A0ABW6W5N0_9ACTN|nr:alpha/beta hydrolase [Actinoplanes globisporus]